jgi:DUF4097 and DUF4098 domain-containing protein YvlB
MRSACVSVGVLSLFLAGCDDMVWADRSDRFTENFSYSYSLKPGGRVSIENLNGSVEVTGWDKDTIEITGAKYAATEDLLRALKIDIQQSSDAVSIRTVRPSATRGNYGARYRLRVPRRVQLERLTSSNGHVEARDIEGPARIRTSNGGVRITNTKGDLEIETSNGSIDVNDHSGSITGHTSNARVSVDLSDPEQGRPVRLESSNGGINLKMRSFNRNSIRLSTSNASINLALPDNAGVQIRADTSNGHISSDMPVQGTMKRTHADGQIGAGGPSVELSTSNGSISLQRL